MGVHQSKHKHTEGSSKESGFLKVAATANATANEGGLTSPKPSTPGTASVAAKFRGRTIDTKEAILWKPTAGEEVERQYHAIESSGYVLPKDASEQDRLETQHFICRATYGGDFVCPQAKDILNTAGSKVLDVGCANGFWLKCVQKDYPNAEYYGVDIVEEVFKPTEGINFAFGNVLERLPFEDNTFDYVHQRLLVMGMPKEKFVAAIRELIRVTKPGGWIELLEVDIVFQSPGPHSSIFGGALFDAMFRRGLECYAALNLPWYTLQVKEHVKNQGTVIKSVPMNWGGDIGTVQGLNVRRLFDSMEDWMHKVMGITREEYRELIQNCYDEWSEHKTFMNGRVVYFEVAK